MWANEVTKMYDSYIFSLESNIIFIKAEKWYNQRDNHPMTIQKVFYDYFTLINIIC